MHPGSIFISHPDLVILCQTAPGISDHESVIVEFSTQIKLMKRSLGNIFLYHVKQIGILYKKKWPELVTDTLI